MLENINFFMDLKDLLILCRIMFLGTIPTLLMHRKGRINVFSTSETLLHHRIISLYLSLDEPVAHTGLGYGRSVEMVGGRVTSDCIG